MSQPVNLKDAERKVFRSAYNDGLWDVFLGCFFLMFAIGPFLTPSLGDFWGTMIFLPFWGIAFLVIWLIRKYVVTPRIGVVKFGPARKAKLARFSVVMLFVNIVAMILGLLAAFGFGRLPGQVTSITFGMILLICFSLAAYFLDFTRLYIYGLMLGFSPLVGEWLYVRKNVLHHGFPVTFGITTGIMFIIGLITFVRLLLDNSVSIEDIPA